MPEPRGSPSAVLLVEDDERIAEPLLFGLRAEGFRALHATDGASGLNLARTAHPDIVLLDIMLPVVDGLEVCRTLRRESAVPIIMLTARGQELDRVMGLEVGADDYMVKPFSFRELVARIRAVLRRRALDRGDAAPDGDSLEVADIVLDCTARQAHRGGMPVQLRQREFDLLVALMRRAGQTVSRQDLLDDVWGEGWVGDPHTLDVHIHWLRERLGDDQPSPRYIQTVRGYGYRFAR